MVEVGNIKKFNFKNVKELSMFSLIFLICSNVKLFNEQIASPSLKGFY